MSDHLIAEANRHAKALGKMTLPTTQPTQRDIQWYIEECIDLRKQLDRECASKREHLRIACNQINELKVQVGVYESENAALREWQAGVIENAKSHHARYEEVAALREDKARLDWLEAHPYERTEQARLLYPIVPSCPGPGTIRAAIDAARKEAQP